MGWSVNPARIFYERVFGLACDGVLCGIFGKVLNTFQRDYGIAFAMSKYKTMLI